MSATAIRTTNGGIAMYNVHAQIQGLEAQCARAGLTIRGGVELVDLLILRAQIAGRIADYERATDIAERLTRAFPHETQALVTRARTRACLHRFGAALTDLDVAESLGMSGPEINAERAAILQAIGRYDEALVMHLEALQRRRTFETLGALAVLRAEQGEVTEAERLFDESRAHFRGVSPFGLAQLDFQRAHLWLHEGDLPRAKFWLLEAWQRVPAFATAEGHLAEVEAELGETDQAITRLRALADRSDDPDYAAQLARILIETSRPEEAVTWRAYASARYAELIERHPDAFADHAAEFYLTFGGDPDVTLQLAILNAEIRPTRRALALLARATA